MNGHQQNEERSLQLHGAVAEKLRQYPEMLAKARERVDTWILEGSVHPRYSEAWRHLLARSMEEILDRLVDPTEAMSALRQCSPFAGVLTPRERWRILRETRSP